MNETRTPVNLDALPSVDCDPLLVFQPIPGVTVASEWPCPACGEHNAILLIQAKGERSPVYYRVDCRCGEIIYYSKVLYFDELTGKEDSGIRLSANIRMRPVR